MPSSDEKKNLTKPDIPHACAHEEDLNELRANFEKFTKRTVNEPRENQNKVHYKNTKNAPEGKFDKEKGKQNKLSA